MKETIEILQNSDIMNQILESEKNIAKMKIKKLRLSPKPLNIIS